MILLLEGCVTSERIDPVAYRPLLEIHLSSKSATLRNVIDLLIDQFHNMTDQRVDEVENRPFLESSESAM